MSRVAALALIAGLLAGCTGVDPVVQQATFDTRYDPVKADTMLAVRVTPPAQSLTPPQVAALRKLATSSRVASRDEFAVVSDGSGGAAQRQHAQMVGQILSEAGARWVTTGVEPSLATGPNTVVVVRSEYLLGHLQCPDYNPATIANPNEGVMPGMGCADSYNMGQMLARSRDAAVGRAAGPADGTVNAAAIARYREGKVRTLNTSGIIGGSPSDSGTGMLGGGGSTPPGATAGGGSSGAPPSSGSY